MGGELAGPIALLRLTWPFALAFSFRFALIRPTISPEAALSWGVEDLPVLSTWRVVDGSTKGRTHLLMVNVTRVKLSHEISVLSSTTI